MTLKTMMRMLIFLAVTAGAAAQQVKVLEMHNFRHYRYDERAFALKRKLDIRITAAGASDRWQEDMTAFAWILDAETRKTVWEMSGENSRRKRGRYLLETEETLTLNPGFYEVYFAVSFLGAGGRNYEDLGDFLEDLFSGFNKGGRYNSYAGDWGISIFADAADEKYIDTVPMEDRREAVVKLCPLGDDAFEKQGFSLSRDAELRIYAIGEGEDGEMYDYGWIVNGRTGETVWEMNYRDTDWAGGADKNRIFDGRLSLPRGDYIVSFVTDGSHSYERWNMMPPRDPRQWGITLQGAGRNAGLKGIVKEYSWRSPDNLIVDITRAGNRFFEERAFTILREGDVRVRCLGEMGSGRRFVDTGYIIDIDTREKVWELTAGNTRRAGGASKNRMFDELIRLQPGNYKAVYMTDDSHAFRRWNASAPYDPEAWGLAIWGGPDFKKEWVKEYSAADDPDVLLTLTGAFDNDRLRGGFTLRKDTAVRVYALGEADGNSLCDYGWIEDGDGRVVWEMRYRNTRWAGGARKNRMVDELVRLDAGEYVVFYRTDGSHSFRDWNDDPPEDPAAWGISIRIEK